MESSQSSQSSHLVSPLHSTFGSQYSNLQYRTGKPLSHVLCGALAVYFEEGLYNQALNLLYSLLAAGGSSAHAPPALLPPAQHIALVSTLTVHPSLTTRANAPEKLEAANQATKYLRLLHQTLGSANANFHDAFVFKNSGSRRRRTQGEPPTEANLDEVKSELAMSGGLWANADDFWHVVGWAFNCSVKHKKRWARWEIWLEFMIGVLEEDWKNRDREEKGDSLIVRYIQSGRSDRGGAHDKRVVRSVFADGTPKSLSEFKEIWKDETKERKSQQPGAMPARRKPIADISIEEDNYGEYLHSSASELEDAIEEEEEDDETPLLGTVIPDGTALLGGPTALQLRMRLLNLLSTVSIGTGGRSFAPLDALYDLYLSHIRPLPTSTFMHVLSPLSLRGFESKAICTLLQFPLRSMISTAAPLPEGDGINQDILEDCYLVFPANTVSVADNAKVSICCEGLLWIFDKEMELQWSQDFEDAVEEGIKSREEKAKTTKSRGRPAKGTAGNKATDDVDRMILRASAERMRFVVETVKQRRDCEMDRS